MSDIKYSDKFGITLKNYLKSDDFLNNQFFRDPVVRNILVKDRFENILKKK